MLLFRCTKTFYYDENDGNGDGRVFIHKSQLFAVDDVWDLPGVSPFTFDEHKNYYEQVEALLSN